MTILFGNHENAARKRAIIYCRVSTDKQEQDGESMEYQEEKCRRYAELHDFDVVLVLKEAKSGFIHYSFREQLTIARQFIRDGMADAIIVWDLRRFSRNFVHSAMIFEEIESAGAEIVSVSENIDNSLTGKLIRSILAWSAESEREKILEYANRHWQTRLAENLPVGSGRAPFGWEWGDKEKTFYVINQEEATLRFSMFQMFVELDMTIRGIAHKLTEDGIMPPAKARGAKIKGFAWHPSTVHVMLKDVANIGVLQICKSTKILTAKGTPSRRPNINMKVIQDGLPAIVPLEMYQLAQIKLKNNKIDKSHIHKIPEDFLIKGHVFCKSCNYSMHGRYQTSKATHRYPYYAYAHTRNKYAACPDLPVIRTDRVDQMVWEDCCRVFERLDLIRDTLEHSIEQSLQNMLEDTKGVELVSHLSEEIHYARQERAKHPEGSYYYTLISQDIREKEDRLRKYEAEHKESLNIVKLSNVYQKSIMGFLNFLGTMQGKYHHATFQEKRNALDVLGVKVYIHPIPDEKPEIITIEGDQEWLTIREAADLAGIIKSTISYHIGTGDIETHRREVPVVAIHREELSRYLKLNRPHIHIEDYDEEWFAVNKMITLKMLNYHAIHRAIERGELKTQTRSVPQIFIHRDEMNRFLRESPVRPKFEREDIQNRVEIMYTPIFTGVQSSFG